MCMVQSIILCPCEDTAHMHTARALATHQAARLPARILHVPSTRSIQQTAEADSVSRTPCRQRYASAVAAQQSFDLTVVLPGASRRYLQLQFRCAHTQTVDR